MSALPAKTMQAHCNKCGGERKHDVLHHEETNWEFGDDVETPEGEFVDCGENGGAEYDLIRCCGCETIALRQKSWSSVDTDHLAGLRIIFSITRRQYLDLSPAG